MLLILDIVLDMILDMLTGSEMIVKRDLDSKGVYFIIDFSK